MNIIDELKWRGAVNQQTDEEGLYKLVGEKSISLYCGIDPTGDSMHIGHLIPFMIMKRFQLAGHHPVILIGGGTGSIGDPSGRKSERVLQSMEQVQHNAECLKEQMKNLFGEDGFRMVNNYDWLSKISLLDFLKSMDWRIWIRAFPSRNSLTRSSSPSTSRCSMTITMYSCRSAALTSGATSQTA